MATGQDVPVDCAPESFASDLVADSQLGGESTQAEYDLAVESTGPVLDLGGNVMNTSDTVRELGAETGGEGSGGAARVRGAIGTLRQCYVCLKRAELPCPLPSSPKSLRPRPVHIRPACGHIANSMAL